MRRKVCFTDHQRIALCLSSYDNDPKPATVTNYGHNEVKVVWDNGNIWKGSRSNLLIKAIRGGQYEGQKVVVADYYFEAMLTSGRCVNIDRVTHHEILDGGKRIEVHSRTHGDFTFIIEKLDGWSVSDD